MSSTAEITGFTVGDVFLTGNPINVTITGDGCPEGCTDYRLLLKVVADNSIHEGGGTYYDEIIPVADEATIDIHGYIDIPVPIGFHWPLATYVHGYYDRSIGFSVTPGESYIDADGVLQTVWGSELGDFFAIRGGVSDSQLSAWVEDDESFNSIFAGEKALTYRANPCTVLPNQPVKLWQAWKHGSSMAGSVSVTAQFSDGTSQTITKTGFTIYTDAVYEFDVQPANFGFTVDDGTKHITSFEVTINGGTETRVFNIDWNYHDRPFFLLYHNGLGAVEDVALTGGWQTGFRSASATVWEPLPADATRSTATVKVAGKTGARVWKVNTGFKPVDEIEALAGDLLMARNAWLLVPPEDPASLADYVLYPVVIQDEEITASAKNELSSLSLTFTEAHDNKYF